MILRQKIGREFQNSLQKAVLYFGMGIGVCCFSITGCDQAKVGDIKLEEASSSALWPTSGLVVHNKEPISPLSAPSNLSRQKVLLGRSLFHDVRLSKDNSISCASCHVVAEGGDDGLPTAIGINGQVGKLNTPTVLNCGLSIAQFWDGRARTLHDQIPGPVHNPIEMDTNWDEVVSKLKRDTELAGQFDRLYQSGLCSRAIVDAIANYEKALITVDSPFDKYLKGIPNSLPEEALAGYRLFKSIGCVSCHQGQAVGGNLFQEFGIMNDFSEQFDSESNENQGRINVTKRSVDLHRFKVPGLRNIELTAPYFHDGTAETLEQAIEIMAEFQLGESLSESEVLQIKAFLISLTGKLPEELK